MRIGLYERDTSGWASSGPSRYDGGIIVGRIAKEVRFFYYGKTVYHSDSILLWIMAPQHTVRMGLLAIGATLALSCSGPTPDSQPSAETEKSHDRMYHVQLDMKKDKEAANRRLSDALAWWHDHGADAVPSPSGAGDALPDQPVRIVWKAPFYRVRLGPYASRVRAEEVVSAVRPSFPNAFVAPEQRRTPQ